MKPIGILSLSLLVGLAAESATAQEVASLVRIDPANRSASPAVTRSIAEYIAARNNATVVQVMARSQPDRAPAMTVEALLAAIESNARIVAPAAPEPAAVVAPAPQTAPAQKTTPVVKKGGNSGDAGGSGGGGGSGGSGGGGGGGW
ncbi:MAG: hypothetical protein AB7S71_15475 [Dongiaceae bacterium]